MPEFPDISIYVESLSERLVGSHCLGFRIFSPFVLRTFSPPIQDVVGKQVSSVSRLGKRIVIEFDGGLTLVIHLMIAGRFQWHEGEPKSLRPGGKATLTCAQFENGHLLLTEAGTKHRASIHLYNSFESAVGGNPMGLNLFESRPEEFWEVLQSENRTLKRALTNPRWFDGIGNAYSDEILHAAKLSPLRLTRSLSRDESLRLFECCQSVLTEWTNRLRAELKGKFPGKGQVTAFRKDFAAHGKFGEPCPVCGKPIQRISYAENETNYCAVCQNEGRLLADRALSRLLKSDWPRTLEEMLGEDQ